MIQNANTLPVWVTWLSALSTIVIALAGVFIAVQQQRINKKRWRHELFDRRFKIYGVCQEALKNFWNGGNLNGMHYNIFFNETIEAKFLLSNNIILYIEKLNSIFLDVQQLTDEIENGVLPPDEKLRKQHQRRELKKCRELKFPYLNNIFSRGLNLL